MNNSGKYDDIINLPHHVSKKYKQMSLDVRAAQFAPFSALTGYDEVITETARLTNAKKEINEELKAILDDKIKKIQEHISERPEASFKYFIPDSKKSGGKYVNIRGRVRKIDKYTNLIILEDNIQIPISEIIEIED